MSPIGIWLYDAVTYQELSLITGHTGSVNCMSFSRDGSVLARGSEDRTVRLWDVATGTPLKTLTGHASRVNCIRFSPDGRTIASGSDDGTIILWEMSVL